MGQSGSWQNRETVRREVTAEGSRKIESVEDVRARDRQLHAIAKLAQYAIRARDLTTFLQEAVHIAAEALGVASCAILEMRPDGTLLLRAGCGWSTESRQDRGSSLLDSGAEGVVQVNIRGRALVWGVFAVREVNSRSLHREDIDFLQSLANIVALSVERDAAEAAQRPEAEVLQTIFDHIPVMISFWDPSSHLAYVNREWERTLGWTLEEARRTDFLAIVDPDSESRREVLEFLRRSDRQWSNFRLRTRKGRTIESRWARFALSDGSAIGFGLDVTDRNDVERALADSEARFANAFQASPVALGISTMQDGRIIDVNESWLEMFGYRREEVIGRTNAELHLSVDTKSRADNIRLVRNAGAVRNIEVQVRRKSGEIRDLIVSAVPVILAGEEESWLSAQLDITDRNRAKAEREQLLESEQASRAAAEAALERLRAIESITDGALLNLGLDELLPELLTRLREALRADFTSVALVDERREELYIRAVSGETPPNITFIRSPLGEGVSGRIAADGQPRIENDLSTVDLSKITGITPDQILSSNRSVMGAPLQVGDKIVGVVTAASAQPHFFVGDDLRLLLVVAARAAPAIERGRLIETVRAGRERLKALSARLLTAHEEERRRLAVELHDELGQVLTAVKINLQSLERTLDVQSRSGDLADAIASVDEAMERVRNLALDLRPSVLDDLGLPAALRWYADRFARDTRIDVHLSIDAELRLEPAVETACFRVAQEALTNVLRHARAGHAWVGLHVLAGQLVLSVRDDGVGFDVVAARERAVSGVSMGLLGMEERVSLLGGDFEVHSTDGQGTEVSARFSSLRKANP